MMVGARGDKGYYACKKTGNNYPQRFKGKQLRDLPRIHSINQQESRYWQVKVK